MMKMNKLAILLLLLLLTFPVNADNEEMWLQLKDDFHMLIAETFHPAEEGDLAPLKEKSKELYTSAKKWHLAKVPPKFTDDRLNELLKEMHEESKNIHDNLQSLNDEELMKKIYHLHDLFHEAAEIVYHKKKS